MNNLPFVTGFGYTLSPVIVLDFVPSVNPKEDNEVTTLNSSKTTVGVKLTASCLIKTLLN